jgi:hypothetical protein
LGIQWGPPTPIASTRSKFFSGGNIPCRRRKLCAQKWVVMHSNIRVWCMYGKNFVFLLTHLINDIL